MKTMYDHDRLIARFPRPKLTLGCSSKNLTRSVSLAGTSLPGFVTLKSVCSCFPMFVIFRPKIQRLGNPFGCTKVREWFSESTKLQGSVRVFLPQQPFIHG